MFYGRVELYGIACKQSFAHVILSLGGARDHGPARHCLVI